MTTTATDPLNLNLIWASRNAGHLSTADAVTQIRALLDVTDAGARAILDDPEPPSVQYTRSMSQWDATR